MSREIKFRAWHADAKDMVYFGLGENYIDCLGSDDGAHYVMDINDHPVMQSTGLHDKNGVEIYEGDILAYPYSLASTEGFKTAYHLEEVKFTLDKKRETYGHGSSGDSLLIGYYFDGYYGLPDRAEVIGNIYETPELLQGEDA